MPDKVVKFEGHGHPLPSVVPYVPAENCKYVYENKMVIDEDTLQPVVAVSQRELDPEIQSCKDECGIAFIMRQVAAGRLSVDAIRDDGQHGYDIEGLPETMNEASMIKEAAISQGDKAAADLGLVNLTEADLQKFIQAEIAKAEEAKKASQETVGGAK